MIKQIETTLQTVAENCKWCVIRPGIFHNLRHQLKTIQIIHKDMNFYGIDLWTSFLENARVQFSIFQSRFDPLFYRKKSDLPYLNSFFDRNIMAHKIPKYLLCSSKAYKNDVFPQSCNRKVSESCNGVRQIIIMTYLDVIWLLNQNVPSPLFETHL